jgi:hypothetical protein
MVITICKIGNHRSIFKGLSYWAIFHADALLWENEVERSDDLLDLNMPESLVDQELTAIGVAPEDLARRAVQFVAQAKEENTKTIPEMAAVPPHAVKRLDE